MDAPLADAWITRAMELNAESTVQAQRLLHDFEEQDRALRARHRQVAIAKEVVELRRALAPALEILFLRTTQIIQEFDMALRLQEMVNIEERTWQLALLCLQQQKRLVEATAGKVRSTIKRLGLKNKIVASAWTAEWETRYGEVLDDIDDTVESIALGLSPKFRALIEKQLEAVAQHI